MDCTTLVPSGAESTRRGAGRLYEIYTVKRFIQEVRWLLWTCVDILGWFVGG